jgi:hypothetical protein
MEYLEGLFGQICLSARIRGYNNPGNISVQIKDSDKEASDKGFKSYLKSGPDGTVIVVDHRIAALSTVISELIAKYLPANGVNLGPRDMLSEEAHRETEIRIDDKDYRAFKNGLLNFIGFRNDVVPEWPELTGIAAQIRDGFVLYLLGHELGHIILGHSGYEKKNDINKVKQNWDMEFEADAVAYDLMYDTMSRLYPDVKYKGQYNIAVETFFLYASIGELLGFVLADTEFNNTHSDTFTRINQLRQKIEKYFSSMENREEPETLEWCEREIEIGFPHYTMKISGAVYAAYKKRISDEILIWAAFHAEKNNTDGEEFLPGLIRDICESGSDSLPALNLPGLDEWKQGHFTRAVRAFAAGKVQKEFCRVLAILYRNEYDYLSSKMESCLGQLPEFREGVEALWVSRLLCQKITEDDNAAFDKLVEALNYARRAASCFRNIPVVFGPQNAAEVAFALGQAESTCGFLYLRLADIPAALASFNFDIDNSPAALESFYGRSCAHERVGHTEAARADQAVWEIVSRAPSFLERSWAFLTTGPGRKL